MVAATCMEGRMSEAMSLRRRAMAGESVHGAMVFECTVPGVGRMMANAGAAFAMFDMEHTGLGYETFKMLVATCQGLPIAPMVRVPRGEYTYLARALDMGAHGVMVPMVESVAEARAIAEATRYPPRGRRGAAFGFAHDGYTGGDVAAKSAGRPERMRLVKMSVPPRRTAPSSERYTPYIARNTTRPSVESIRSSWAASLK